MQFVIHSFSNGRKAWNDCGVHWKQSNRDGWAQEVASEAVQQQQPGEVPVIQYSLPVMQSPVSSPWCLRNLFFVHQTMILIAKRHMYLSLLLSLLFDLLKELHLDAKHWRYQHHGVLQQRITGAGWNPDENAEVSCSLLLSCNFPVKTNVNCDG